jgi:ataxia telangiectasia mutated family protein
MPLCRRTASDVRMKRVQGAGPAAPGTLRALIGIDLASDNAAELADRALSTVSRKLEKSLSVEYTVNELIAEATDPMHLANLFPG